LIVSSGEDVPYGQSLRARVIISEVAEGSLDWRRLTRCQRLARAGLYAQAMAGYVRWLAPQYDAITKALPRQRECVRAYIPPAHRKTATLIADVALGLRTVLRFAVEVGAYSLERALAAWEAGWRQLTELAAAQQAYQRASDPVARYFRVLSGALAGGRAHVAASDGGSPDDPLTWGWRERTTGSGDREWVAFGERIGWIDAAHDSLYLEPTISLAVAKRLARDTGEPITIQERTLRTRLRDRGLLRTIDTVTGSTTIRRHLEGQEERVLHLPRQAVHDAELSLPARTNPRTNPADFSANTPPVPPFEDGQSELPHEGLVRELTPEKSPNASETLIKYEASEGVGSEVSSREVRGSKKHESPAPAGTPADTASPPPSEELNSGLVGELTPQQNPSTTSSETQDSTSQTASSPPAEQFGLSVEPVDDPDEEVDLWTDQS
jgi:hypothetical protein